ncbi:MAG: LpqB family beta-propeller domain-containing protein [Nocardioidaceae bacterium]
MNVHLIPRLVAAVVLLAAAAGCVSIPESSSVHAGRALDAQDERPLSSNAPNGPTPGAGRKEIAAGYLAAMLAFPPAPDVVRQFLTPSAAAEWSPNDRLVVYTDSDQPRVSEKAKSVVFNAQALGSLDDRGRWSTATTATSAIKAAFTMTRVNGEWRMRNPLPGSYVDQDYFLTYYGSFALYYFDPATKILAADPVHMLLGDSLATALVKDLLQGPTDDIAGAVSSSVPATTTIEVGVSISPQGVAEVPLSDDIMKLSANDRRLFAAQLAWTLRPLQEIKTVVVTVGGTRIDLGVGKQISIDDFSGYDPAGLASSRQLYGLTSQGLVAVSDTKTATVAGPIKTVSRGARSAAVDPDGAEAAVVSGDGSTVTVSGLGSAATGTSVWFRGGDSVLRPSWDIYGVLWLVDNRPDGARLFVANSSGTKEVDAPGLTGKAVHSIAVSRDGVRLAAVVGRTGHRHLVISVIDRDPQAPATLSLRAAQRVVTAGIPPQRVSSVSWFSPTSVAALGDVVGGQPEPSEFSIDGSLVAPFGGFLPIKPISLASGPNLDTPAVIGDSRGQVFMQTPDSQWLQIGGSAKIRDPFYPG